MGTRINSSSLSSKLTFQSKLLCSVQSAVKFVIGWLEMGITRKVIFSINFLLQLVGSTLSSDLKHLRPLMYLETSIA